MTTILKIGGSVVTNKRSGGGLRGSDVRRIAKEIGAAIHKKPQKLIIVHGAGGEAHKVARLFKLQNGAKGKRGMYGTLKTHRLIVSLDQKIAAIFEKEGIPVFPVQTSACFSRVGAKVIFQNYKIIEKIISLGLIPMLYGDMIPDDEKNFSILSGDTVVTLCAEKFKAERILFASDVDGVYPDDPQLNNKSKLLSVVTRKQIKQIFQKKHPRKDRDSTGQMRGKLENIFNIKIGADILIFNGLKPENIQKALMAKRVGTLIKNS